MKSSHPKDTSAKTKTIHVAVNHVSTVARVSRHPRLWLKGFIATVFLEELEIDVKEVILFTCLKQDFMSKLHYISRKKETISAKSH